MARKKQTDRQPTCEKATRKKLAILGNFWFEKDILFDS